MNKRNLRQHMADFYGDKSPSSEMADRLVALAEVDRGRIAPAEPVHGPDVVYRYPGRWLQGLVGVAASIALALSAVAYYKAQDAAADRLGVDARLARDIPRVGMTSVSNMGVPRLVAVKFQIDGCPLSAGIEPVFAELIENYAERPVMFARYDMTNAKSRCFSKSMATGLGFNWACEGAYQSGTILLIDRERREVLAKVTDGLELPMMVQTLDRALD